MKKSRIAIFASGSGTNAENIIKHFDNHPSIEIVAVLCNKPGAGVIEKARKHNIPVLIFSKEDFKENGLVHQWLINQKINYIVLAGFLWLIPEFLVKQWSGSIINIHPALLPKFGGKGMYGEKVHKAVIESGEKESGITIHRVDEHYDHGEILFQARCQVLPDDTPEALAHRIHQLEYLYYPGIIEHVIENDHS